MNNLNIEQQPFNQLQNNRTIFNPDHSSDALQVRLNTDRLIEELENFLRGEREIVQTNESGQAFIVKVRFGEALANEIGIQNLIQFVKMTLNQHSFQGNIDKQEHYLLMIDLKKRLSRELMIYGLDWGMKTETKDTRFQAITVIESAVLTGLSRARNNTTNQALMPMIKMVESNTLDNRQQPQRFSLFNWGKKSG